jgi:hypothetical protein
MNSDDISVLRFNNQHIADSKFNSVKDIASWMGAMQAQDFNMSKWAYGIRLNNLKVTSINDAINSGEIVRSHLLRPTWHFVSADDIYWISELTAPQIKSAAKSREKQLGLDETVIRKSYSVLEKSLRVGGHLTRQEIISDLRKAGIETDNNRASHLLIRAETEGIICSGKLKEYKQTYTLLPEWIPRTKTLNRDEALKELALRYFTSHGPATLNDFNWWSGLSIRDSRQALDSVKSELCSEVMENNTYWFASPSETSEPRTDEVFLLPAYDEFIISYRDRTASLKLVNHKKAVSDNGIFYPVIIRNGQVIGTWKHTVKKDLVFFETKIFGNNNFEINANSLKAFNQFASFLGKKAAAVNGTYIERK